MGKKYTRTCDFCGSLYTGAGKAFCSKSCRMKQRNLTDNPSQSAEARRKISAARQGKPTTLGRVPSVETRAKISRALQGKPAGKRGPMSEETKARLRAVRRGQFLGPDNFNWRGGTSPRDWKADRYRAFLFAVWTRDAGRCRYCGNDRKKMQVHHITSWIEEPALRYDPVNGILLCTTCHRTRERLSGRYQITEQGRSRLASFARSRSRDAAGHFREGPRP